MLEGARTSPLNLKTALVKVGKGEASSRGFTLPLYFPGVLSAILVSAIKRDKND